MHAMGDSCSYLMVTNEVRQNGTGVPKLTLLSSPGNKTPPLLQVEYVVAKLIFVCNLCSTKSSKSLKYSNDELILSIIY